MSASARPRMTWRRIWLSGEGAMVLSVIDQLSGASFCIHHRIPMISDAQFEMSDSRRSGAMLWYFFTEMSKMGQVFPVFHQRFSFWPGGGPEFGLRMRLPVELGGGSGTGWEPILLWLTRPKSKSK
jgi:hypothetical protein